MSIVQEIRLNSIVKDCIYNVNRSLLKWQVLNKMATVEKRSINPITIDSLFRNWLMRALRASGIAGEYCNMIKSYVNFSITLDATTKTIAKVSLVKNTDRSVVVDSTINNLSKCLDNLSYNVVKTQSVKDHNEEMRVLHGVEADSLLQELPILDTPKKPLSIPKSMIATPPKNSAVASIVDFNLLNKTNFEKYVK